MGCYSGRSCGAVEQQWDDLALAVHAVQLKQGEFSLPIPATSCGQQSWSQLAKLLRSEMINMNIGLLMEIDLFMKVGSLRSQTTMK